MCSISTPKNCGALTRNSLLELMSQAKMLSGTESSDNYIPTQNTLVRAFKKSRITLLPSCRHRHRRRGNLALHCTVYIILLYVAVNLRQSAA